MFPKYSELVKVVMMQIIGNNFADKLDNALKAKMHADFTSAINTLIPNHRKISLDVNNLAAQSIVEIQFGSLDRADLTITVTADFGTREVDIDVQ